MLNGTPYRVSLAGKAGDDFINWGKSGSEVHRIFLGLPVKHALDSFEDATGHKLYAGIPFDDVPPWRIEPVGAGFDYDSARKRIPRAQHGQLIVITDAGQHVSWSHIQKWLSGGDADYQVIQQRIRGGAAAHSNASGFIPEGASMIPSNRQFVEDRAQLQEAFGGLVEHLMRHIGSDDNQHLLLVPAHDEVQPARAAVLVHQTGGPLVALSPRLLDAAAIHDSIHRAVVAVELAVALHAWATSQNLHRSFAPIEAILRGLPAIFEDDRQTSIGLLALLEMVDASVQKGTDSAGTVVESACRSDSCTFFPLDPIGRSPLELTANGRGKSKREQLLTLRAPCGFSG